MDVDLGRALALLDGDLFRLTGHRAALTPFIEKTRACSRSTGTRSMHWRLH
jgi:hypothetical protein